MKTGLIQQRKIIRKVPKSVRSKVSDAQKFTRGTPSQLYTEAVSETWKRTAPKRKAGVAKMKKARAEQVKKTRARLAAEKAKPRVGRGRNKPRRNFKPKI